MGETFGDKYSLLHFAVGVIFRFIGISFGYSVAIHILFELLENTSQGVHFIDTNPLLKWWPGGKKKADTFVNSVGDTFFFCVGWLVADKLH